MASYFLWWILRVRLLLAWLFLRVALRYLRRAGHVSWRFGGMVNIHVTTTAVLIFQRADIVRLVWQYPEISDAHREWILRPPSPAEVQTFFPWRRSPIH
jgi:hypothetical protein